MSLLSKTLTLLYLAFLGAWLWLWRGRLPHHIDASLYAYPDHWVNREAFRRGFLPLWNPYIACGTPHAANWQSACFYPPFWLFQWTGLGNSLMVMAVAHSALAFAGCRLWLRRQNIAPFLCSLGALSFAGSAHLTLCWNNLPFIATAAWIPWVFWAFDRCLQNPLRGNWLLAGTALSLQVLAGYPFFTFYTVIFLGVWFYFQKPLREAQRGFWLTLAGVAAATCLQWLPFLELLTYAKPGAWTGYPYFNRPLDDLTLLKPDVLGTLGSASYQGPFANGIFNLYFGLVPLAVLLVHIPLIPRMKKPFWILAALAWLLWMAGPHFPLWRFFPLGLLQWLEPSKAVGLFLFCAVTAVAFSLRSYLREKPASLAKRVAILLLSLVWVLDLFRLPSLLLHPIEDPYRQTGVGEKADKIRAVAGDRRLLSLRTSGEMDFTGASPDALGHNALLSVDSFLANSNAVWGLRSADRYLYLQVDGSQNLVRYYNRGFPFTGDLLAVAGVGLLMLPQALPPPYHSAGKMGDQFLMARKDASPELWVVPGAVGRPSRAAILQELSGPHSGWRQKAYLEDTGREWVQLAPVGRGLAYTPVRDGERPCGSRASLNAACPKPSFAVFNETYAPGWHAWVDGKPAPILRAYGLFMAVAVEAGSHQVDFRYEPATFRLGLFVSLLALAVFSMGLLKVIPVFRRDDGRMGKP